MSLDQTIQEARRALNRDLIPARLGNGTGTVYDLNTPGHYWLRKLEANGGLSQAFSLPLNPLANIPPKDGLPVSIGYDARGIQCIWQADTVSMQAANVNPYIINPLDTAVYGKTSQTNLATLYCQRHGDTVNYPFTAVVFPAPLIINAVAKFFAGGSINLASFLPASGFHRYAVVFVTTTMTLEAFASTAKNLLDPLTVETDIAECLSQASANSVPVWAWELQGSYTGLSADPTKNVDLRQIINAESTGTLATLQTTDNTQTTIASITVSELSLVTITGTFSGVKSDYSAAISGTFVAGVRRASGGNATLVGVTVTSNEDSSGTPSFTVDADTGTQTARMRCTGITAENWSWTVTYKTLIT